MDSVSSQINSIPRKRWFRIIPAVMVIYIIAYMDRMNVSFAIAGGMLSELGLSATLAGIAAGVFFFGYLFLQVPGGYLAEHGSAKKFVLCTIIAWGLVSMLSGLVQNEWQLLGARFLLGVAEGGLFPSIIVILNNWFPKSEIGRANALFITSMPISSIITNPISGYLISAYGWRSLFLIEGIISLALIFIWLPLISNKPEEAKWLSDKERDYLVTTIKKERQEIMDSTSSGKWTYKQMLMDKTLWVMVIIYVCFTIGQYGYSLWLPTMLKNLTATNLTNVGFLAAIPFVAAVIGTNTFGALSDKFGNCRLFTALAFFGFGGFLFLSMQFPNQILISFSFLVVTGFFLKAPLGPYWSIPRLVFPVGKAGVGVSAISSLGNLGGFFGPFFVGWLTTVTGDMKYGVYTLVISLLIGGLLTMTLPKVTAQKSNKGKETKSGGAAQPVHASSKA